MTTPKRVGLAFGCMIFTIAILAAAGTAESTIRYGLHRTAPNIEIWAVVLLFAFPGWILSLPFVIFFKSIDGWRIWAIMAIGTAIGPGFISIWTLIASRGRVVWRGNGFALGMSLLISSITTGLYVLLLWRSQRKSLAAPLHDS
jgi:hypothetical protein